MFTTLLLLLKKPIFTIDYNVFIWFLCFYSGLIALILPIFFYYNKL